MPSLEQSVGCVCRKRVVTLRRMPSRLQSAFVRAHFEVFGGVCDACGRGIDLLIEKKPGSEARRD